MKRLLALAATALLAFSGCSSGSSQSPTAVSSPGSAAPSSAAAASSGAPITLTFWWWAEPDAPGADKWFDETAAAYHQLHPNITVQRDTQSTDTLVSAFSAAAAAKSGPDLASQWAGSFVLTQAWAGAIAPISDLVPKAELDHWLNLYENQWDGKDWAASLYVIGSPMEYNKDLFTKAGLDPQNPPTTWPAFLAACDALSAKGITPLGFGNKEGSGGLYLSAALRLQTMNSLSDYANAALGQTSFLDPTQTTWLNRLQDLGTHNCFPPDVSSLSLDEGRANFDSGAAAMTWGTDGNVKASSDKLGAASVGVMKMPVYGTSKLADVFNATQSTSFFVTSWSKHPQEAADFLVFMHTPDRLTAWYKETGVVPADDRFDVSAISNPALAQLQKWESTGPQIWLLNFMPTQVYSDGDKAATSLIMSKGGTVDAAAQLIDRAATAWRTQHPDDATRYGDWIKGLTLPGM